MIGQEELEAVQRVMNSKVLSGYTGNWTESFWGGEEIQTLEKEWQEYFGVKHAIACNSATSGLWLACASIGLSQDDEVVCSPYTMTCSATVPLHFGAEPVFADIEPNYFCLDPKSVEEKITERTKAIIVVDLFGMPYDADAINEIAERKGKEYGHKIYVIEDAAQAIGAKYKGRYAGTLGDIGVFSLNFHKHIHCGEGGIIVTNDDELAFRCHLLLNHAEAVINDMELKLPKAPNTIPDYSLVGMNLRMTELQAAIAREQLKKLDGILKVYRDDAKYFPVKVRPECEHSYYRYAYIRERDLLINISFKEEKEALLNMGFDLKQGYIKPIYQMPLFQQLGYAQDLCPVCEDVEKNIILAWKKEAP